jgi:hypothetical protein
VYIGLVKRRTIVTIGFVTGLFLVAGAYAVPTGTTANPYGHVVDRNSFGLKPLPPPVGTATNAPPPSKIKLLGIANMFGTPKVILKNEDPPKPGQPPQNDPFVLSVGQAQQDIEVKAINEKAKTATIINHGVEMTLALSEDIGKLAEGPAPAAPSPAAPAASFSGPRPSGGRGAPPGMPNPSPPMGGARGGSTAVAVPAATPSPYSGTTASFGGSQSIPVQSIPARPVRLAATSALTPEQTYLFIEAQREAARQAGDPMQSILPPTPMTPPEYLGGQTVPAESEQ